MLFSDRGICWIFHPLATDELRASSGHLAGDLLVINQLHSRSFRILLRAVDRFPTGDHLERDRGIDEFLNRRRIRQEVLIVDAPTDYFHCGNDETTPIEESQ